MKRVIGLTFNSIKDEHFKIVLFHNVAIVGRNSSLGVTVFFKKVDGIKRCHTKVKITPNSSNVQA